MIKNMQYCPSPFQEMEIHATGEVYTCCPNWNKFYSIGNIYKDNVENIWNSDKAKELRKRVLNNDYSLCDKMGCNHLINHCFATKYDIEHKEEMQEYPKVVKFVYDKECNIACKICRNKLDRLTDEELETLNSKIDNFFLPILQHAQVLIINAKGDPFGSRHSRLLIKKAAERYPNLKFDFHTNGILCNETHFKNLNITPERIENIRISIHAATAKTYAKTVPNGEFYFPHLVENLKYLGKLQQKYGFGFFIHFVVTADNYYEIPLFIELAKEVNASPRFWEFRKENCAYMIEENLYISRKEHPEHEKLAEVMQNPEVKKIKEYFSPVLAELIK